MIIQFDIPKYGIRILILWLFYIYSKLQRTVFLNERPVGIYGIRDSPVGKASGYGLDGQFSIPPQG
jgi:hypothetical protein